MPEIIRYEDEMRDGLFVRYFYGLGIFGYNNVTKMEDAMINFYRALVTTYPCAAQVGLLPLDGLLPKGVKDPCELFAPLREGEDYFLTNINSYAHGGLWVEKDQPAGCFFPHFPVSFFEMRTDDGRLLIDDLLGYDQPFFYVDVDDDSLEHIKTLYEHPPLSNEPDVEQQASADQERASLQRWRAFEQTWWKKITSIIPVGILGGYDDDCITAYSRDPAHFNLLEQPLEQTCLSIRSTPWFQAHQHELRWPDEENDGLPAWHLTSLMLPSIIEENRISEAQRRENRRRMENQ